MDSDGIGGPVIRRCDRGALKTGSRGLLQLDERRPWEPDPPLSGWKLDFDLTGPEEEGLSRAERRRLLEAHDLDHHSGGPAAPLCEARNQGSRPTCLAFAASDAHAALRRAGHHCLANAPSTKRSNARAVRRTVAQTLPAMLETLRHDGQPEEAGWPYLSAVPADLTAWLPPAEVGARFRRAGAPHAYYVGPIIAEIDAQRPVILLMTLSRSFSCQSGWCRSAGAGEVPEPARRHAVIAVGHGHGTG